MWTLVRGYEILTTCDFQRTSIRGPNKSRDNFAMGTTKGDNWDL